MKLVVTVPLTHAEAVRTAIGDAGGGVIGNYTHCSFSVQGTGRFRPAVGAQPHTGIVGRDETVAEECVEVTVDASRVDAVIAALKRVHPYEEPAIDVYPLRSFT